MVMHEIQGTAHSPGYCPEAQPTRSGSCGWIASRTFCTQSACPRTPRPYSAHSTSVLAIGSGGARASPRPRNTLPRGGTRRATCVGEAFILCYMHTHHPSQRSVLRIGKLRMGPSSPRPATLATRRSTLSASTLTTAISALLAISRATVPASANLRSPTVRSPPSANLASQMGFNASVTRAGT